MLPPKNNKKKIIQTTKKVAEASAIGHMLNRIPGAETG
jgi:hypothetical protein